MGLKVDGPRILISDFRFSNLFGVPSRVRRAGFSRPAASQRVWRSRTNSTRSCMVTGFTRYSLAPNFRACSIDVGSFIDESTATGKFTNSGRSFNVARSCGLARSFSSRKLLVVRLGADGPGRVNSCRSGETLQSGSSNSSHPF